MWLNTDKLPEEAAVSVNIALPEQKHILKAEGGRRQKILVWLIALVTCGCGLVNLESVINPSLPERFSKLLELFPLEFLQVSRFFVLLTGFALVISSLNILKRKQRAFNIVALLSVVSIIFHLTKGIDYEEATVSAILLLMLFSARKEFTVKSADLEFKSVYLRILTAFVIVAGYGIIGFYLLESGHFNFNFHLIDAIQTTFSIISLIGKPQIVPQTGYAVWFTRSVYLLTFTAIGYSIFTLFRPVAQRFGNLPGEKLRAAEILNKSGRSSMDFFKLWRDKSYFFSKTGKSFISYRVARGVALALGDPVGESEETSRIIGEFCEFCRLMDWETAFYQTTPEFLAMYENCGLRRLKIGEDAIVELENFKIESPKNKKLRKTLNKFERENYRFERFDAPLSDEILKQMEEVSDDWLTLPGRRERAFSLGSFDPVYLRETTVYAVFDAANNMLAFVNKIPSYADSETTFDLMRHRDKAPNGTMDFIFTKLILEAKKEGFKTLTLGMSPLADFVENPFPTPEERAVQIFLERMNFLFSYTGLKNFKAKFAGVWEPRYLIFRHTLDLPKIGLALLRVAEIEKVETEIAAKRAKNSRSNRFKKPLLITAAIVLPAFSYFAWYELHPRPLPPAGKVPLVLRGQPQDIYFFPATDGARTNYQKVLFLPGDGGWEGLAITIAQKMSDDGYEVYALDTKRYLASFTNENGATLTEPQVIDDFGAIINWMNPRMFERITLVGWSEGAGLAVLGASGPNRTKLYDGVVVLGLPDKAELGWKTADDVTYFTGADPDEPLFEVAKYLPEVAPLPLAFIHSSGDQFISKDTAASQLALANKPKKFTLVQSSDHAFSDNQDGLLQTIDDSLDWTNKILPDK